MHRKVVKKKEGVCCKLYQENTAESYRSDTKRKYVILKTFQVPQSFLENHISGKYNLNSRMGLKTSSSRDAVESKIVETLKH